MIDIHMWQEYFITKDSLDKNEHCYGEIQVHPYFSSNHGELVEDGWPQVLHERSPQ